MKNVGPRIFLKRLRRLEIAMRAIASGMDNAFRNTLVVEVKDLFPKMKILNQRRTSIADLERIEVIRYWPPWAVVMIWVLSSAS